jgi:hypothetical protein
VVLLTSKLPSAEISDDGHLFLHLRPYCRVRQDVQFCVLTSSLFFNLPFWERPFRQVPPRIELWKANFLFFAGRANLLESFRTRISQALDQVVSQWQRLDGDEKACWSDFLKVEPDGPAWTWIPRGGVDELQGDSIDFSPVVRGVFRFGPCVKAVG